MARPFLIGLLANAFLLVGSVGAISWATGDSPRALPWASEAPAAPRSPTSPPRKAAAAAPTNALAVSTASAPPVAEVAGALAPLPIQQRLPPPAFPAAAPKPTLQNGLPPQQHLARISFRGEMLKGFATLQQQVARCSASDASFTLDVETVEGGVRIVDAKLESQGQASEASITCARSALRGQVITAPSSEPGKHWQMPFAVNSAT